MLLLYTSPFPRRNEIMNGTTEKNTCSNDADTEIQLEYYEDYDDSSSVIKEEDFATVCCDFTENDSQNEEYRQINDIDVCYPFFLRPFYERRRFV